MTIKYGRPLPSNTVGLKMSSIFDLTETAIASYDIWVDESTADGWVDKDSTNEDVILIPFTNLHTRIENATATNPKVLLIHFNRTIKASSVGFGCYTGGNFSNIEITLLGSGGVERTVINDSADNTKLTSKVYRFTEQLFNAIRIEFHTADTICLSNITIQKEHGVSISQRDLTTDSLRVVDYAHAELHSGSHYNYRRYHNVPKNGTKDHLIITPNTTKWAHFVVDVEAITSSVIVYLYEGATYSAVGTPETPINRNRNYTNGNTTLIYEDPTITAVGTLLADTYVGAGKNSEGGRVRDQQEIILKQNTVYLVRVVEQNIAATPVNIAFDWYEHTNKNTL